MHSGIIEKTLEWKKEPNGKTSESHRKSGVYLIITYQCWFLSFEKYTRGMQDVIRIRWNWVRGIQELSVLIFITFL